MNQLKLGIIGVGFVGDAVHNFFHDKTTNLLIYDKFKNGGIGTPESMLDRQIIYLCLPTLYSHVTNSFDLNAIHSTLQFLSDHSFQGIILIKSTIEPGRSASLSSKYQLKIIHNPEFLTARTARADFANQKHIVIGTTEHVTDNDTKLIIDFYTHFFPNAHISISTSTESESMKIFVNSFYSIKVQAFNEFYLLCQANGADFNKVTQMMLQNGWINPMHTQVPGPDGNLSYGGACFPKDTQALLATMKDAGTPCQVLEATVNERNTMRDD